MVAEIVKPIVAPVSAPLQQEISEMACDQRLCHLIFLAERTQEGLVEDMSSSILAIRPEVQRARVGWLAVSEPGSLICIGTVGDTEDEARRRFQDALQAWQRLHDNCDERPADSAASQPQNPTGV